MYDKLLTISDAAKLLGISSSTLRRLERDGEVEGYGLKVIYTPGGQRRYMMDEIQQLYTQSGFSGQVGFGGKPAILIRDWTFAFTDPNSKLSVELRNQIRATRELAEAANKIGIPVFFTATIYERDNRFSELWGKKFPSLQVLDKNSSWLHIHPELEHIQFANIHQTVFVSDLWKSPTADMLEQRGIDTVILAGATTSGSIRATAVEALQRGYKVIVSKDVVGDRSEAIQNSTLLDLNGRYVDVVTMDKLLQYFQEIKTAK